VRLSVRVKQPAVIGSACGEPADEPHGEIRMPLVDPLGGATGTTSFVGRPGSIGVEIARAGDPAVGALESHLATASVSHLFFPVQDSVRGRTTRLPAASQPGLRRGDVLLAGDQRGSRGVERVRVAAGREPGTPARRRTSQCDCWPRRARKPGAAADVTVSVLEVEETPAGPADPELTLDPRLAVHNKLVGSLDVLGKVVTEKASIVLRCTGGNTGLRISGRIVPAPASGQAMLEYRSPLGGAVARFVTTNATGAFSDSFATSERGPWQVQAFWPGDATHAPAESSVCSARN
jgi:hypothetical protein